MDELKFPGLLITLFTKIFGTKANFVLSGFMFLQTDPGKKLLSAINEAFATPAGEEMRRELVELIKPKEPNA
jgi:hypothetical protein